MSTAIAVLVKAWAAFPGLDHNGLPLDDTRVPRAQYPFEMPRDAEMLRAALAFLAKLDPLVTVNPRCLSSYQVKHEAERWEQAQGRASYISNGALIAAAVYLDIPVQPLHAGCSPNAAIGVSRRSLRRLARAVA
jgi:hypothetical protein